MRDVMTIEVGLVLVAVNLVEAVNVTGTDIIELVIGVAIVVDAVISAGLEEVLLVTSGVDET